MSKFNHDERSLVKNITKSHQLRAHVHYLIRRYVAPIEAFISYRRIYRNYATVIFHILTNEYPIEAFRRNGNVILFHNRPEIALVTRLIKHGCNGFEIANDRVTILSYSIEGNTKRKIELFDGLNNGDLFGIFFDRVYDFLPIHGKTVIDIGANIGDSCIYFALRRPNRIIALEPFPKNYEFAKKNIVANGFADKILLQLAGCHAETGNITVDPSHKSDGDSQLLESKQGIKIRLVTLQDIIIENKVARGEVVLKMDCQECEYDTILSSSTDTLRFFSHIQLEYHKGYKNLKEKLENAGFEVTVTSPSTVRQRSLYDNEIFYEGYLYATKRE
jgi:FkbM family methyltransferase